MDPWKRRFLLETIIFRFHVNFWGCISGQFVPCHNQQPLWLGETTAHLYTIGSYDWTSSTNFEFIKWSSWRSPSKGHLILRVTRFFSNQLREGNNNPPEANGPLRLIFFAQFPPRFHRSVENIDKRWGRENDPQALLNTHTLTWENLRQQITASPFGKGLGLSCFCLFVDFVGTTIRFWIWTSNIKMLQITTSWWLNQPISKICSSNWIISPRIGEK